MSAIKFWVGVALITANFILGFLAKLVPLLYYKIGYYSLNMWIWIGFGVYAFSWLMLFLGVYLCGKESFDYAARKYKEYRLRTMETIKDHSQKTYSKVKEGVRRQIDRTKKSNIR